MNVINELDKAIVQLAKKSWWEHHPKTAHSITDFDFVDNGIFYGTCIRKQYYDWTEVEPLWDTIKPTRCYAREFGKYVQKFVEDLLASQGFLIEKEVKLPEVQIKELTKPLHGRIDDIIRRVDSLEQTMLEIKSCHGRKFNSPVFGIAKLGPTKENKCQLGFYRKHYPEVLDAYHLIYFSREDFNRRDFIDSVDMWCPQEWDFRWWVKLEKYLCNKQLPVRDYRPAAERGRKAWSCVYCDYDSVCWDLHDTLEGEK